MIRQILIVQNDEFTEPYPKSCVFFGKNHGFPIDKND